MQSVDEDVEKREHWQIVHEETNMFLKTLKTNQT